MKKLLSLSILSIFTLFLPSIHATAAEVNGNVVIVSDYIGKRGISLTDGDNALQGELSISNDMGFYAGIWGSNVDFDNAKAEVDFYLGYNYALSKDWKLGTGAFHYANIGESGQNFQDYFVSVKFYKNNMFRYNYSPDFSGIGDSSKFAEYFYTHQLGDNYTLKANISRQNFKSETILEDFNIVRIVFSRRISNSVVSLGYSNTDSDNFGGRADAAFYLSFQKNW